MENDPLYTDTELRTGIFAIDELTVHHVRLAVLSNKPHAITNQCVAAYLSKWEFDVIIGQQTTIPKKPDPAGATFIANRLGMMARDFLFLGDSGVDMQTTAKAGMIPVGVLWGFRSQTEL